MSSLASALPVRAERIPSSPLLEYFFEQWVARVDDAKMAMARSSRCFAAMWPIGHAGKDDGLRYALRSDRDQHDVLDAHLASERNLIGVSVS